MYSATSVDIGVVVDHLVPYDDCCTEETARVDKNRGLLLTSIIDIYQYSSRKKGTILQAPTDLSSEMNVVNDVNVL